MPIFRILNDPEDKVRVLQINIIVFKWELLEHRYYMHRLLERHSAADTLNNKLELQ